MNSATATSVSHAEHDTDLFNCHRDTHPSVENVEMEIIKSQDGKLSWIVKGQTVGREGKKTRTFLTVACAVCGHELSKVSRCNLTRRKNCPGCSAKPAALKTDSQGACMTICEFGMVEFVRDYQEKHGTSEREAVRHFVEVVKAHLSADDPVQDSLTEESARASVRRATGKKIDESENMGRTAPGTKSDQAKRFRVSANIESVQKFLDKHLPGHEVVQISTGKINPPCRKTQNLQGARR